jgi:hypothetical protein
VVRHGRAEVARFIQVIAGRDLGSADLRFLVQRRACVVRCGCATLSTPCVAAAGSHGAHTAVTFNFFSFSVLFF